MCKVLKISRSLIYYKIKYKKVNTEIENLVIKLFKDSLGIYCTRKIKKYFNELNREFNNRNLNKAIVIDLIYVKVRGKWHYICILVDLFNREIIGYSAGSRKKSKLVLETFSKAKIPLNNIKTLHTDRDSEFKNKAVDDILSTFNIKRSLNKKGCPYDNAFAEATFKIVKTEFVYDKTFKTFKNLKKLKIQLFNYINWYNNHRIHSFLNYYTPAQF